VNKRLRLLAVTTTAVAVFYLSCIHYTEAYQVAITWNWITGNAHLNKDGGFHFTPPWVEASRIDIRPQRVCITSTARAYNCKLVQFDPRGYREFLTTQGFHYYWLNNRISWNSGYDDEYRGMRDLLRGYAFSGKTYPFLTVLQEYGP
jgi:hypothetical protein